MSDFEQLWNTVESKVELPGDQAEYFDHQGPLQGKYSDRRRFQRFFLRGRAILDWNGSQFGVYTKDVSRSGIVVIFSQQLFPLDTAEAILPDGKRLSLQLRRCRRIDGATYECGFEIQV